MGAVEAFVLIACGYTSGISILSGFVLSAISQVYVKDRAPWRGFVWLVCMATNTVFCALAPVFLIALLVYGSKSGPEYFWQRLLLFAVGLLVGGTFTFISVRLINQVIRKDLKSFN